MKTIFRYFFLLVLFCVGFDAKAQSTIYPFQLNAVMLPPYTNCIGDYLTSNRMQLTAILRDMTYYTNGGKTARFRVRMKVKQGNTIYLETETSDALRLELNSAQMINKLEPQVLFDPLNLRILKNLDYRNNGWCLPEGGYEFVFQLYDYYKGTLPLSEPVTMYCYLQQAEPPIGILPDDGDCVSPAMGGVQFQWITPIAMGPQNRAYALLIKEVGAQNNEAKMFSEYSAGNKSGEIQQTIYNNEFAFIEKTSGNFVEGNKYLWRVKAVDLSSSDARADKDYYAYKNGGYSQWYTFTYGGDCKEEPVDMPAITASVVDRNKKIELTKAEVKAENKADLEWTANGTFSTYKLYVYKEGDESSMGEPIETTTNAYTVENLEPGVAYECYVIGFVYEDGNEVSKSPKSNIMKMKIEVAATSNDCDTSLDPLECDNSKLVKELKAGDYFYANGKTIKLTKDATGSEGSLTGEGVYTADFMKKIKDLNIGLEVKFNGVSIHNVDGNNVLCKGTVIVTTDEKDKERNLMFNLNELANKLKGASEASKQQEMASFKAKDLEDIQNHVDQCLGSIVECENGDVYAVSMGAEIVAVGKTMNSSDVCDVASFDRNDIESSFGDAGTVTFKQSSGLNNGKYDPIVDEGPGVFSSSHLVGTGYKRLSSDYIMPYIAMVQGDAREVLVELSSGVNASDVEFYCHSQNKVVKLIKTTRADGKLTVRVFGGTPKTGLEIYACSKAEKSSNGGDCSQSKTLGGAMIYTMSSETHKVLLVPVATVDPKKVNVDNIATALNTMFKPLGKTFEFELDDNVLSFDNLPLNTDEKNHILSKETDDMIALKNAYAQTLNGKSISSYNACLFLVPQARKDGLQGYMPRGKSAGYIFVGEGSAQNVDPNIIAHELCHGLYGLEHTFDYPQVNKGAMPENILDYHTYSGKEYLSKYFQWAGMQDSAKVFLVFDGVESGENNKLYSVCINGLIGYDKIAIGKDDKNQTLSSFYRLQGGKIIELPYNVKPSSFYWNVEFDKNNTQGARNGKRLDVNEGSLSGIMINGVVYNYEDIPPYAPVFRSGVTDFNGASMPTHIDVSSMLAKDQNVTPLLFYYDYGKTISLTEGNKTVLTMDDYMTNCDKYLKILSLSTDFFCGSGFNDLNIDFDKKTDPYTVNKLNDCAVAMLDKARWFSLFMKLNTGGIIDQPREQALLKVLRTMDYTYTDSFIDYLKGANSDYSNLDNLISKVDDFGGKDNYTELISLLGLLYGEDYDELVNVFKHLLNKTMWNHQERFALELLNNIPEEKYVEFFKMLYDGGSYSYMKACIDRFHDGIWGNDSYTQLFARLVEMYNVGKVYENATFKLSALPSNDKDETFYSIDLVKPNTKDAFSGCYNTFITNSDDLNVTIRQYEITNMKEYFSSMGMIVPKGYGEWEWLYKPEDDRELYPFNPIVLIGYDENIEVIDQLMNNDFSKINQKSIILPACFLHFYKQKGINQTAKEFALTTAEVTATVALAAATGGVALGGTAVLTNVGSSIIKHEIRKNKKAIIFNVTSDFLVTYIVEDLTCNCENPAYNVITNPDTWTDLGLDAVKAVLDSKQKKQSVNLLFACISSIDARKVYDAINAKLFSYDYDYGEFVKNTLAQCVMGAAVEYIGGKIFSKIKFEDIKVEKIEKELKGELKINLYKTYAEAHNKPEDWLDKMNEAFTFLLEYKKADLSGISFSEQEFIADGLCRISDVNTKRRFFSILNACNDLTALKKLKMTFSKNGINHVYRDFVRKNPLSEDEILKLESQIKDYSPYKIFPVYEDQTVTIFFTNPNNEIVDNVEDVLKNAVTKALNEILK